MGLGAFGLTSCSGGGNVRFAWYGGAERQRAYMALLDEFSAQHPDEPTIDPEYADYDPYQDRMATQFAANDAADLFFIAGFNTMEYDGAGNYHDLDEFIGDQLDLSDMDQELVDQWRFDGALRAMPYAYWNTAIRSNRDFLEEVGMELPDDETWTWDDFIDLSQEFTDATEDGRFGSTYAPHSDLPFNAFLRQGGQELFTTDGEVGFDAEGMGDWMDMWERMRASGAAMSVQQQEGVTANWERVAPHVLFNPGNSNHLAGDQPSVDWELDLHLCPTLPDPSEGHRFLHLVRFAMYSRSDNPELTAELMSFLLNSERVPELLGQNSGVPTSLVLQEVAKETADSTGQKIIEVIEREAANDMRPRAEVPRGAGSWRDLMARAIEAIAIEGDSISTQSERFVNDLNAAVDRARD